MNEEKLKKIGESSDEMLVSLLKEAEEKKNLKSVELLKEVIKEKNNTTFEDIQPNKNIIKQKDPAVEVVKNDDADEGSVDMDDSSYLYDLQDSEIPFDLVDLPSKGLIYKRVKSKIPVSYLTAADEDLITSPNLYMDGKVIDLLLKRKIMDKNINPENLCKADRDAVIIWLRATGYGNNFPVSVKDPATGEEFETEIDLSEIKDNEFKLKPDEDGLFEYTMPRSGHVVKFRFLTNSDENNYKKVLEKSNTKIKKHMLESAIDSVLGLLSSEKDISEQTKKSLENAIDSLEKYNNSIEDDNLQYINGVTYMLQKSIVSINGEKDKKFINKYINVMPAIDSMSFRRYLNENSPSLDYSVTVNRPESLGGGSFKTFLELDASVFLNIPRL